MGPFELGSFTFSTTTTVGCRARTYPRLFQKASSEVRCEVALREWFLFECAVHSGEVTYRSTVGALVAPSPRASS